MKIDWKAWWQKCKDPPFWVQILVCVIALLSGVGSIIMVSVDFEKAWFAALTYALFAVAALSLAYAVYLIVRYAPRLKRQIIAFFERYDFTYLLLRNYGFRTVVMTIVSFLMSFVFSAFNAYMGIALGSIWYGALATYYICLALMRGGILVHHQRGRKDEKEEKRIKQTKTYRNCGIVMLVLNVTLSSAIAQMIFDDRHFSYAGWLIFGYAAYAFYKITMSIINLVRARKQDDLTVQAIRNVNLIDATVSILALQTALLITFQTGDINISHFNTMTGIAVSATAIGISIFMIIKGNKRLKLLQERKYGK